VNGIAFVAEGNYDEQVLKTLIPRIRGGPVDVPSRICGKPLRGRYVRRLKELAHEPNLEKALVVSDAHSRNPRAHLDQLQNEIQNVQFAFPVLFVVVVQELEAWLLADHLALNAVAAARGGQPNFRPLTDSPESFADPKRELRVLLANAGIPYTQAVAREIAENADLQRIGYWCRSFRRFQDAVIDP